MDKPHLDVVAPHLFRLRFILAPDKPREPNEVQQMDAAVLDTLRQNGIFFNPDLIEHFDDPETGLISQARIAPVVVCEG